MRSSRAPAALGAAAAMVAGLLAGCGGDRVPASPAAGGPHPAVTPRQAVQIVSSVDAALVRAVRSRDAGQLAPRAVGPAQEELRAGIAVQAALRQEPTVPPTPGTPRLLLTLAGPWPRWFAVAGASPGAATPLLEVVRSADPRAPYGLWARLRLLPGAALPEVASAAVGAPVLPPAAPGLVATPEQALTRYTDLLNRGDASAFVGQFTADAFRTELTDQLGADRKAFASDGVGQVTAAHVLAADAPLALRTLDGGALVIGRIDETYTATVTPGRGSVRLDPQLAALAGRATVSHQLVRRSVEVVAFHVPRAGSSDRITLVAASKADVSATGT